MHLDERSAAFFGLGLAKASRQPVGLLCTSGTAATNFTPAVVEAFYGRVPLIVLTADRPHELRDNGALQTIDQLRLFGPHVKWFVDLPEPLADAELLRYVRAVATRAVAASLTGPRGPVHLNCPFREPLVPYPSVGLGGTDSPRLNFARTGGGPPDSVRTHAVLTGPRVLPDEQLTALADELTAMPRGLIVCGPQDDPELALPLLRLAKNLGYPVLADPLSGLRCGRHERWIVLDCYDAFLREASFSAAYQPQIVIRFGGLPTSRQAQAYLQRHPACRQIVVDGDSGWNEPSHLATGFIHADARLLCQALVSMLPSTLAAERAEAEWAAAWRRANRQARDGLAAELADLDELFEGKVFAELAELLPDGALVYAGNSMPVRDLDSFFPASRRAVRFLANRGASGIDGVVSSALGASAAGLGPLVLVIGDLSFYHDSNGLLAARKYDLNATIVLLNNDGGGIFSFLPQASEPDHFETLFGTPHGLDFQPLAETYGAAFTRVGSWKDFRSALRDSLAQTGLQVIEVPTQRARNVELHRQVWRAVSAALLPRRSGKARTPATRSPRGPSPVRVGEG
jgi:2-succinyl-5-enolpyruvyl-6-hydroxy-3-cyclohexene-1-carboxylate synthase